MDEKKDIYPVLFLHVYHALHSILKEAKYLVLGVDNIGFHL